MDREQAVFERLNFKMRSSTALRAFNNYKIVMFSNCDNINNDQQL